MGNQVSGDGRKGKVKKNHLEKNNKQSVFGELKCQPPFSKFVLVPCTATARKNAVSNGAWSESAGGIRLRVGDNIVGTGGGILGLGIPADTKGVLLKHGKLHTQMGLYGRGVELLAYGTVRVRVRRLGPNGAIPGWGNATTVTPESTFILGVGETLDVDAVGCTDKRSLSLYSYTLEWREVTSEHGRASLPRFGGGREGSIFNASPVRHVGERGRGVAVATSGGARSGLKDAPKMRPTSSLLPADSKGDGDSCGVGGGSGAKRFLGVEFADNTINRIPRDTPPPPPVAAGVNGEEDVPIWTSTHEVVTILDDDDDDRDWPVWRSCKRSKGSFAPSEKSHFRPRDVVDLCDTTIDLCDSSDDETQVAAVVAAATAAESIVRASSSSSLGNGVATDTSLGVAARVESRAIASPAAYLAQMSSTTPRVDRLAVFPARQPVAAASLDLDAAFAARVASGAIASPTKYLPQTSLTSPRVDRFAASPARHPVAPATLDLDAALAVKPPKRPYRDKPTPDPDVRHQQNSLPTQSRVAAVAGRASSPPFVDVSRGGGGRGGIIPPREVCDWRPREDKKTPATMDAHGRKTSNGKKPSSLDGAQTKAAARKRTPKAEHRDISSGPICHCFPLPKEQSEAVDAHLAACNCAAAFEAAEAAAVVPKGSTEDGVPASNTVVGGVVTETAVGSHMPPSLSKSLTVGLGGAAYESMGAMAEFASLGLRPAVSLCDRIMQEMLESRCRIKTECLRRMMITSLEAFPGCWQPLNWGRFEDTLELLTIEEDPCAINTYVAATNIVLDCVKFYRCRRRGNRIWSGLKAATTTAAAAPALAEDTTSPLPPLFLGAGSDRDGRRAVERCAKWAIKAWARRGAAVLAGDLAETLACMSMSRALAEALEAFFQSLGEGVTVTGGGGGRERAEAAARLEAEGCDLVANALEAHRTDTVTAVGTEEEANARGVAGLLRSLAARPFRRVLAEVLFSRMSTEEGGVEVERLKALLARHKGGGDRTGISSRGEMTGSAMLFADMARLSIR